ncbi:hypothetical protein [Streptomyces flavovirens]|uniref:hypothetical protein n=1 Tax=Streptomyces flavovirens TaxID=52258 RepID=UPI0031E6575F
MGTGGDMAKTVNISTMSAIVVAGTGAKVVKHGNRASSSASGASDVLEKLGVNLELTPQRVVEVAEGGGHHVLLRREVPPRLRYAARARKELGTQTTSTSWDRSPTRPRCARRPSVSPTSDGADRRRCPSRARGNSALVFRGDDGLDELTTTATSRVWTVRDGSVHEEPF